MAVPYQPTYTLNPKYGFRYGPSTFGPTTTNLTSPPPVGLDGSSAAPPPVMGSQEGQYNQNIDGGSDYLQDQQTQQQNQARITQAQSYGYTQGVQNPSNLVRAVPIVGNFIADSIPSNAKYNYGTSGTYDAEGNVFDSSGRAYNPITGAPAQSYAKATGEDSWLGNWIGFGTKEGMFGPSSSYGKLKSAGEDPINSFFGSYDNSVYKQMDANPNLSIQGAREARRRGFASPIENLTFDITQNTMNAQTDEFGNLPTGPVWGTNPGDYVQSDQGPLQVTEGGQLKGPDGFTTVMIDGVSFVNTDIRDYGNLTDAQKSVVDNRTSVDDNTYETVTTPGDDIFSTPPMDSGDDIFSTPPTSTIMDDQTEVLDPASVPTIDDGPWGDDNTNNDNTNDDNSGGDSFGADSGDFGSLSHSDGGKIPAELSIDNIKNMGNMMNVKKYSQKDRYGNEMSVEFYDVPDMKVPDHPGGPKGTDTVPAWLTPGEFVMNAEATRMFEPQIEQMNNAGRSIQAQQGGTIPEYAANGGPVYAAAGGNSGFLADILKRLEGVKSEAYLDSAGNPTIGAGSTRGVQMGDTASDDQVDSMLSEDIAVVDQDYGQLVSADLNTNQEAAVKSLLFNIGGPQFANSKARAALNAGDFDSFKKEAAEFRKVGDEVIPGLENRRAQELALFDSPVGQDPWGINKRQVSTRDDRVTKLNSAGQPTDLAMQAAILGQDAETTGEIVTPPPIDRGPPSPMSMVSPEEQNAFQRDVAEAQKATREQGMYDPDGNIEAIQTGIDQAQILENQRRMQQGQKQVPPMIGAAVPPKPTDDPLVSTVPPSNTSRDDRVNVLDNAAKGGNTVIGTLQGNDVYQDDLGEYINTPEGPVYLDGNQLQAMTKTPASVSSSNAVPAVPPSNTSRDARVAKLTNPGTTPNVVPELKEPPKDLPDNLVFNPKTGKVEFKDPSTAPQLTNDWAIEGPEGARAQALKLKTAEEEIQTAIANGYGPGDPIFDGALARRDALKGADKKLADLQDQKKSIFTEGELEVTKVESKKKQEQADKLVELGMTKEAKKVQEDADALKAKQERLEGKSQELVKDDQTEALDPAVPTIEGVPPGGSSTGTTTAEEVVNKTKDDGSVPKDTTPGDAEGKGETAPPGQISKAESFLSGILGDLFDKGELKRMALMYVGGRMLGGSHNGSLNFAAKAYVKRVDSKASEHKKYVKELTKDGAYSAKSIALYNKTKNISDLEKKGATYSPTGGAPITKMIPQFNKEGKIKGYKKATLVPVKNSITGGTHYQSTSGAVMHPAQIASLNDYRKELDDNTEAYKQRRSRILVDMERYFSEIRDKPGNSKGEGDEKEYIVGVGPAEAALAYYDWAKRQGVDPDSTAGRKVMTQAYDTMVAEAAGKSIKYTPNDFTQFLEAQQLRESTGAPELFMINENVVMNKKATPKYVQADKMSLLYQNLDTVILGIPNSSTNRGDIIGIAIQKWNKLDSTDEGRTLRKKYNDSAEKSAGESGFYKYMMNTAQALHAELNKPKQ